MAEIAKKEEEKKPDDNKKPIEEKKEGANSEDAKKKLQSYIDAVVQMCNEPSKGQSPPQNIAKYLPYLITSMAKKGLLSKNHAIAIFATAYIETGSFAPVTEEPGSISQSDPIGGPQFAGRGFIQITHDFNYEAFAKFSGLDTYNKPELLNDPVIAADSTVWFYTAGTSPPPAEFGAKQDWGNVRSCINTGQPNQQGGCNHLPEYLWACEKGLQVFPDEGIDPAVVGLSGVASSEGANDFDPGTGGVRNLTGVHNPTSQQSALEYALALSAFGRSRELCFKALMDVASFPAILDVDIQTSLNITGFGKQLDGDYVVDSIDYYFGSRLEAHVIAYKPDPNAPPPQVFAGTSNPNLGQPEAGKPGSSIGAPTGKAEKTDGGIKLNVPYLSQLDNTYNPSGSCQATSLAMVMLFLGVKQKNPSEKDLGNEIYPQLKAQGIPGTPDYMVKTAEDYGLKDTFEAFSSEEAIKKWLDSKQIPVVVHGWFTGYGHVVTCVGYNKDGFIVNDPWGKFLGEQGSYDHDSSGAYNLHTWDYVARFWKPDGQLWIHFIEPG